MKRRNILKSVGSTTLLPTISVPTTTDSVPFDYLDSLFSDDYTVEKIQDGILGKQYTAVWEEQNRQYHMEYRVFSEAENKVDIRVNAVDDCIFEHYYWNPSEHLDAYNLLETGRRNRLEDLLTVLDCLKLDSVEVRI
jgi:hypothetical protein